MSLDSPDFGKMIGLIRDSFRVRKNTNPIYVDIAGNLDRVRAQQHQVIFGRRGSGKSCLLMHSLATADSRTVLPVYILADEYKRLTYPDILIRLLIEILEAVPVRWRWVKRATFRRIPTATYALELRKLLDIADEQDVVEDRKSQKETSARANVESDLGSGSIGSKSGNSVGRTSQFKERKLDTLERHLKDGSVPIVVEKRSALLIA